VNQHKVLDELHLTICDYSVTYTELEVVHKGRPQRGRGVGSDADKGKGEFDSMRMSATQYCTKACGVSCQPYSDSCGCTKWTAQVARRLLSVAPWSVA